jgi:hypothetical protein
VKLENVREAYYFNTGKLSDIVRQLAFAGIALVWIFKADIAGRPTIPSDLMPATLLLMAGLTFDLLHYVAGSLIWGMYNRLKERAGTLETAEFAAPREINWPLLFFFWTKTAVMISAYALILRSLYYRL